MSEETLPRTRADAIALGVDRYFNEKPCRKGHIAPHRVGGACTICAIAFTKLRDARRTAAKRAAKLAALSDADRARFIKRSDAKARGLSTYFTGRPCPKGHVDERRTDEGSCCECMRQRGKAWRSANREKYRAIEKASREKHYAKIAARQAAYRLANPEKRKAQNAAWYRAHPEVNRAKTSAYNAAKRSASPPWLTSEHWQQMQAVYAEADRLSRETGIPHDVDHIVPILGKAVCGLHVPCNLQVLTASKNRSKGNGHGDVRRGPRPQMGLKSA